jgi:hypothetical protein
MARLVLVKIGVDVIQFDEPAFNCGGSGFLDSRIS